MLWDHWSLTTELFVPFLHWGSIYFKRPTSIQGRHPFCVISYLYTIQFIYSNTFSIHVGYWMEYWFGTLFLVFQVQLIIIATLHGVCWCLQDTYVIYPSFLCESKISRFCANHVMSWLWRKNWNVTEKMAQKWRHIETVFADTIILCITV